MKKLNILLLTGFLALLVPAISGSTKADDEARKALTGSASVPFFVYHYILPPDDTSMDIAPDDYLRISDSAFEQHLKYLKKNGHIGLTVDEYLENRAKLGSKFVVLTFDDGTRDHYKYVFPLLKKYGMKGTFFINPQNVGSGQKYMTWKNLKEMQAGGMQIGNHSMTHAYKNNGRPVGIIQRRRENVTQWKKRLNFEIDRAQLELEKRLDLKPTTFGLPFGWYTDSLIKELEKRKFNSILTVDEGVNTVNTPVSLLKRQTVFRKNSFDDFLAMLNEKHLEISDMKPAPGKFITNGSLVQNISCKLAKSVPLNPKNLIMTVNFEEVVVNVSKSGGEFTVKFTGKLPKKGFKMVKISYKAPDGTVYVNSWSFLLR